MARRHRAARSRGDRGAVLVELALVVPLLSLIAFATIELGHAWVAGNRVEGAVGQAARLAATSGSRVEADRDVLVALRASLPEDLVARVDRVVVFRADDAGGRVPDGCIKPRGSTSEVGTASCNTYTGNTMRAATATSMAGFGGGVGAKDRYWPPAVRRDTLAADPDYLGVWIRTTHDAIGGLGFTEVTLVRSSIGRVQPDLAG